MTGEAAVDHAEPKPQRPDQAPRAQAAALDRPVHEFFRAP